MPDPEGWHFLEHEESGYQSILSNTTTGINNNINNNAEQDIQAAKRAVEFVEVDTLKDRHKYDPNLVRLCTFLYAILPATAAVTFFTLIGLLFTKWYFVTLIYFSYVFLTKNICNKGGYRVDFVYNSKFWSYLAAYFPIRLRHPRDFELDPNKNYIVNYTPHAIAAFGSVTTFATNGLGFQQLFPNIKTRFLVHESSFLVPLLKEVFTLRGDCSVNSKSIDYVLSKDKGNLFSLVVGGLAEADISDPVNLKVVLANRKGFIKKALTHGTSLIPCIAFGENSVYTRVEHGSNSIMKKFRDAWYKVMKFKHPLYYGRSLQSSEASGLMPYSRPITVALGRPIDVEKVLTPSQQEIDSLHNRFMDELGDLYEQNSDLCDKYDKTMVFV